MSKGLEALKTIRHIHDMECGKDESINKDFDVIEKELKDYQEIKEIAKRYNWDDITGEIFNVRTDKKYRDLFNSAIVNIQEDYRKARALEIIKEKPQATLWLFQHCDKKMEYEDMISLFKEDITKEQFYLLKEVLM